MKIKILKACRIGGTSFERGLIELPDYDADQLLAVGCAIKIEKKEAVKIINEEIKESEDKIEELKKEKFVYSAKRKSDVKSNSCNFFGA